MKRGKAEQLLRRYFSEEVSSVRHSSFSLDRGRAGMGFLRTAIAVACLFAVVICVLHFGLGKYPVPGSVFLEFSRNFSDTLALITFGG